jgi:hypothetical protein
MPALDNKAGELAQSEKARQDHEGIQSWRGQLHPAGLVLLPLDHAKYTVTAGAGAGDTFDPQVNGVSLVVSPVVWTTTDDATADAIVAAINANAANHRYWAIKTDTDDFSVYQRRHDADGVPVAFTMELEGDADGTLVDFAEAGQEDAIPVILGAADNIPATYPFYELGVDTSGAHDLNETGSPRVGKIKLESAAAQPWVWWHGLFNATALDGTGGRAVAAETEQEFYTFSSMRRDSGATGYIVGFDSTESDVTGEMLYI